MDSKRLIDILSRVDDDHFAIIENNCAELFSKADFYATPTPNHTSDENAEWEKTWDLIDDPDVFWVKETGMAPPEFNGRHKCSRCFIYAPSNMRGREELTPFCPHCGAVMKNGETGD